MTLIDKNFVFPVYIHENTLDQIFELCLKFKKEIFGYLIGSILKWKNEKYIIIKEQIFIEDAVYSSEFKTFQIIGTAGQFDKALREIKQTLKDENLFVVGWWHSHIGLGCFLSPTDIVTQQNCFPESYQVALVIDPVNKEYKFFRLNKNSNIIYKAISNAIIKPDLK